MRTRRLPNVLGWLTVVLAVSGCIRNSYDVELTPRGPVVERKLGFQRQKTQNGKEVLELPEADELSRLARAYQAAVPERATRHYDFRGEFRGRMPDDVGNFGTLTNWHTQFGSASVYIERFRGRTDLVADLDERRAAAEKFCDLIAGWLKTELETEPRFPALKAFLAGDFRRDVQNIGLYVWMLASRRHAYDDDATSGRSPLENLERYADLLARLQNFLTERGYISVEQWPEVARALNESANEQHNHLLALLQRQVATRMGLAADGPIPPTLGFLADKPRFTASLDKYLRSTDDYRRLAAGQESRPPPMDVLKEPLARMLFDLFLGESDSLNLRLKLPSAPLLTNGRWMVENSVVRWETTIRLPGKSDPWPATAYAIWCEPNIENQTKTFGRVVLTRDSLLTYCFWRASLTEDEAQKWDELIDGLAPGPTLMEKLKAFRFPTEDNKKSLLSDSLREPILKSLP